MVLCMVLKSGLLSSFAESKNDPDGSLFSYCMTEGYRPEFDMACTRAYADVLAATRKPGSGIEAADALMAAIALENGFSVATRDVSPFLAAGVNVINPWKDHG